MARQPIRIGARGSKLSRVQAEFVRAAIAATLGPMAAEVIVITTSGDRIQDRTLTEIGGKGLFTKEIEEALLDGRIDCAVHSLKDMPTESPAGLVIAAVPAREDPRDAFVSQKFESLDALPPGAVLGTASLRRQAQALCARPDLKLIAIRGNVDTRLAKLDRGEADALVLAAAGLHRLGLGERARTFLDPVAAPPAPGQGAIAIQTREDDSHASWLEDLRHRPSLLAVTAERAALAALDGSCRTAIGAYARIIGDDLVLDVEALSPDGRQSFRGASAITLVGEDDESRAREFGLSLGDEVRARAGDALSAPV
ncbi:MAG TPA: hydroxymethylbilane synthase [Caulobacteraceae bacterium]